MQIYLRTMHCDEETDEVGADEPYAFVVTVDMLARVSAALPIPLPFPVTLSGTVPTVEVVRYGVYPNVESGTTVSLYPPGSLFVPRSEPFWGIAGGAPQVLRSPNDAIFVVILMENDNGDVDRGRLLVKGGAIASLASSVTQDRASVVRRLIDDLNGVGALPTGFPNFDDRIGAPQELQFSADELARVEAGAVVSRTLEFIGDGGHYHLTFEAAPPPPPPTRDHGGHIIGGGSCFTGETPVRMADGTFRPIEQVRVGDRVLARDEFGAAEAGCDVTGVHSHPVVELLRLGLSTGRVVDTTPEHRFRLYAGDFVPAGRLRAGDRLDTAGGATVAVRSAERVAGEWTVFNLSVDRFPTFFVSEDGVLVHNVKNRHAGD